MWKNWTRVSGAPTGLILLVLSSLLFLPERGRSFDRAPRCSSVFSYSQALMDLPPLQMSSGRLQGQQPGQEFLVPLHRPERQDLLKVHFVEDGAYPVLITARGEVIVSRHPTVWREDLSLSHSQLFDLYRQEHGQEAAAIVFRGYLIKELGQFQALVQSPFLLGAIDRSRPGQDDRFNLQHRRWSLASWLLRRYQILPALD